jgi:hypothetical protein
MAHWAHSPMNLFLEMMKLNPLMSAKNEFRKWLSTESTRVIFALAKF